MTTTRTARLEHEVKRLRAELANANYDRNKLYARHEVDHLKHYDGGDSYKWLPSRNCRTQEIYIHHLEEQIRETRLKYQQQIGEVKIKASELEQKLQKVYKDMTCITEKAKQVDKMQQNIDTLKSKLERRDLTIARFNEQYTKFLTMVKKFQTTRNADDLSEIAILMRPQQTREKHKSIQKRKPAILADSSENINDDNHVESKSEPEIIENFMFLSEALKRKLQRNWTLSPTN